VPELLVRDVLAWLAARGFDTVEEVRAAQESLLFSLPRELRRDLKAAEAARAAGVAVEAQPSSLH
jgi:4-hydroxy-3-methylbut-2-enyl diphosphate reductase